jgi:hypothetical protein
MFRSVCRVFPETSMTTSADRPTRPPAQNAQQSRSQAAVPVKYEPLARNLRPAGRRTMAAMLGTPALSGKRFKSDSGQ